MIEEPKDDFQAYKDTTLLETINKHLRDKYGKYDNKPHFRVVWSDDEFEKRWVEETPEGMHLLNPEVSIRPKYRQYAGHRYILERFVPVPKGSDLVEPTSYEPMWTFQTSEKDGCKFLPVRIDACEFIIDSLLSVTGKSGHKKYRDETMTEEYKAQKLQDMMTHLFGNETNVGDALAHKYGVTVPGDGNQKEM